MIVTLTGPNDHARKRELSQLVAAFVAEHGDMAVERLDGEEATVDRMRESVQSMPFLTARKLVILLEPSKQKEFAETISDILDAVAETTDVILYEPKLDKRSSYYKTLKKQSDFRESADLDTAGLTTWVEQYVAEQGGAISRTDARLLIDRIGPNQQLLKNELDKLLVYAEHIDRKTIELLTERTPQSTIFELLDAAFTGNTQRALDLYHEQRALKVEPQAIIAMLAWQLHILATVKAAGNRSTDEIAKLSKLNPFVVRKSQNTIRQLTFEHIKTHIASLLQLDTQLKRSSIDADDALQLYFMRLANR